MAPCSDKPCVLCPTHCTKLYAIFKDGELKKKVEGMGKNYISFLINSTYYLFKEDTSNFFQNNAGYAMNIPTFEYYRSKIVVADRKALASVDNIPKEKWTQLHDDGRRWGHMTSNLVESQNNMYKGI